MFAPKAPKPQRKTGGHSINQLEPQRSAFFTRSLSGPAAEKAAFQHTIRNQAAQPLSRQNSRLTESEAKRQEGKDADPTSAALGKPSDLSWDFSKIPIHPPNLPHDRQTGSFLAAPPATSANQKKLKVGPINHPSEHEADRIADQVLRTPSPGGVSAAPPPIRRFSEQANEQLNAAPASVERALSVSGRPLEEPLRHDMEERFGYDFSGVRVHSSAAAEQSARDVNAHAYTVGQNLFFGAARFAPTTQDGVKLLAHELVHVVQGANQNGVLRRAPASQGPHTQPDEARLRVTIVEGFNARKISAVDAVASAIERGDRDYLAALELTSKQVDILLNNPDTPQFKMTFGTAAELALEKAIRFDPFLNQYVKRGPVGWVPRGVGKPDWRIETPSSSIPVDLMTPEQVEKKTEMWRRQWRRGKPKWYIEKGLNTTYERPKPRHPMDLHQGGMPPGNLRWICTRAGWPPRQPPMELHQGGMPPRQPPMELHQGGMPPRQPPMELHQGGMPPRQPPMELHQGGMPPRQPPMELHQGGMPPRQPPMELHQGGMPPRQPPMELHQGGMPKPPVGTAPVRPTFAWKAGLKAGAEALGWALIYAGLGYLVNRRLEKELDESIDMARHGGMPFARSLQRENPSKPVYMKVMVRSGEDTRYVPIIGFLTEVKLDMLSVGWVSEAIDPPIVEVEDTRLTNLWHPHVWTIVTYTELLLPSLNDEKQAEAEQQANEAILREMAKTWKPAKNADMDGLRFADGKVATTERLLSWAKGHYPRMFDDPRLVQNIISSHEFVGSDDARKSAVAELRKAAAVAAW